MNVNLIRDLDTKRDKEQEDSFVETMNFDFYFVDNKVINKIELWKLGNVKKLIKALKELAITKEHDPDYSIDIYYSAWGENTELLINSGLLINKFVKEELTQEQKDIILSKDINAIHALVKEIQDFNNLKLSFIETITPLLKDNKDFIRLANAIINNKLSTIDIAVDNALNILIMEEYYE